MLRKLIFVATCFLCLSCASAHEKKAQITFKNTVVDKEKIIREELLLSSEIKDVISLINEKFKLNKTLKITFGSKDGPYYDSEKNEISIPYQFFHEVKDRFDADKYEETGVSIKEATIDSLMHTMFHEIGHALVVMYDLPILGKEEEAVDSLATILLIEYFEDGEEVVLSAADLFNLESKDIDVFSDEDFWDEHGLDVQRYFSTICLVYGSDPKKYAYLKKNTGFPAEKAEECIDKYEITSTSWFSLLDSHMKQK